MRSEMSKLDLQDLWWEHSIAGLAIVSSEGIFEEVNPTWAELLGYTTRQLIGKPFADITHPKDLADDLEMVRRVASGEEDGYIMHKRYIHKLGHSVWAQLKVVAIKDENGKFHAFFSQVIPAALVQQAVTQGGNARSANLQPAQEPFPWRKFFADNAKWIVPMLLAGLSGASLVIREYILWKLSQGN